VSSDTTTPAPLGRRTLLKGVTALGAGLALGQAGFLPSLGAEAAAPETIQDILDITVTTEMFGVTFLGAALDSNARGNFDPPWLPLEVAIVTAARGQEQAHLDFFMGLGGRPLTRTFNAPNPLILRDRTLFFDTVVRQETREVAAQLAAMTTFVAQQRPDLVKVSYQYAAEEAEHRLVASYSLGTRPANNYGYAPMLYETVAEYLAEIRAAGIIDGPTGAMMFPGPGTIDYRNVIERTPSGPAANGASSPIR